MRILLVNYMETTFPGGINTVVREIATKLAKNGHEIIIIQTNNFDLPEVEYIDGYKIIRISSFLRKIPFLYDFSPEAYFYVKKEIFNISPDIVHIHGYQRFFSSELMYIIKKMCPTTPIIFSPHFGVHSHDSFAGRNFFNIFNQLIGKKIMSWPKKIIAASKFEYDNLINIFNLSSDEIVIVPHGVKKIDLSKKEKEDEIKLLYVGYLLELKGVQYIIETLGNLINKNINASLTIIGEGRYEKKLKKMANQLKLNNFIEWKGFINPSENKKILKYFKDSDIFLLLSKSENYGIVVAEALAMGTPTIVTNTTALKEFLDEPGCFGVDYPPNPEEVANLILEICNKNFKVYPVSEKIMNWKKVTEEYEMLYKNLLKSRKYL